MSKTKFVFAVSFCAMFAVNAAVATAPKSDNTDIGNAHSVFEALNPTDENGAGAGIAGVTYVNRAVNKAGAAAIAAEAHAAASGAYAVSAKSSADSAATAAGNAQTAADNAQSAADAANAALSGKQDKLKAGTNITIATDGTISANDTHVTVVNEAPADGDEDSVVPSYSYTREMIDEANSSIGDLEVSKQDKLTAGENITIATDGTISAKDTVYTLPTASASILGGVKVGTNLSIDSNGVLSAKDTHVTVDSALSSTSTNPVQNNVINSALSGKQATIADLAEIRSGAGAGATALQKDDIVTGTSNGTISVDGSNVAVKGLGTAAYTAATAYATAAQGALADSAVQPGDLANVATTGSYNDLSGKPTIPSGALASKNTITNTDVADNAAIAQSKINGLTTALSGKQDKLKAGTNITIGTDGTISATDTHVTVVNATPADGDGDSVVPSYSFAREMIDEANSSIGDLEDSKQNKLTTSNVVSSGNGNVVTAVTAANGTVTVTKGTTLGSLATKSAVASADITDGTIATADIAGGAVTAAKTSGVIGKLPSGSETATALASIWVQ